MSLSRTRTAVVSLLATLAVVVGMIPLAQQASAAPTNLALNGAVTASGQESPDKWGPELAVDGDSGPEGNSVPTDIHNAADASRWSSNSEDSVWIQVDLGEAANISEVKAHWGNTYPLAWSISGSADGTTWTEIMPESAGPGDKGGWTNWTGSAEGYRYIKVTTHGRSASWGTGLWELQVMGEIPVEVSNLALERPVTASGDELPTQWGKELAVDGDSGPEGNSVPTDIHNASDASRWSSNSANSVWIQVDLGNTAVVSEIKAHWGNTYPLAWSISGSADGTTWTEIMPEAAGPAAQGDWTTWTGSVDGFRYIKVTTNGRSAPWGTSLWELQVFGTLNGPIIEPVEPFRTAVVPAPASAEEGTEGDYVLTADASIVATGDAVAAANQLAETLRTSTGFALPVAATGQGITLAIDPEIVEPEGYELSATADGVTISAGAEAGLFYGAQSLLQLLGPWAHSPETVAVDWTVSGVEIADVPRYEWRGFMLDSSRSFYPVDEVKQIIDQMAQYKLNVLHMHFADDQGWRIAISNEGRVAGDTIDYSLLTSVSGNTAVATTQWTDLPGRTGFYTADDFAEIIAYADAQHVAIVPEVDGPAHSNAMLHAIPELNTAGSFSHLPADQRDGTVAAPVNTTTSVGESSLDPGSEVTYTVLTHILEQIVAQNTSRVAGESYFHLGGDESHNTTTEAYQTFMQRMGEIVTDLGATPVVWNEAASTAYDQLPEGTIVQHWAGNTSGARNFVINKNGRALASPASRAYLPQVPGSDVVGPGWACGGACGIDAFYEWNPLTFMGLSSDDQLVGVEAPIWSEHLRSLASAEFLMYPRLMATAEVAWSPQSVKDIDSFRERLTDIATSLTSQGRNFYYGDADWGTDIAALVTDGLTEDDAAAEVAVAAIPATLLDDVEATLTLNGADVPVTVSVDRPYQRDTGKFDGRQVNGLFRFALGQALVEGDYAGTLTVTANGETVSTPVELSIAEGTGVVPSPTPSVTVTVTADPTATATATVTATATATATATSTSTATVTTTATATTTTTATTTATVDVTETATSTATATETRTVTAPPATEEPTKAPTSAPPTTGPVDLYTTPGYHKVNGREWFTECEPYSQTTRCHTDIWASQVRVVDGQPQWVHGWAFNNLTYLPMDRSVWGTNPLARDIAWTSEDGRKWYTECGTATTGSNGCRSYIWTTVWEATSPGAATFHQVDKWVFNNMVRFK